MNSWVGSNEPDLEFLDLLPAKIKGFTVLGSKMVNKKAGQPAARYCPAMGGSVPKTGTRLLDVKQIFPCSGRLSYAVPVPGRFEVSRCIV